MKVKSKFLFFILICLAFIFFSAIVPYNTLIALNDGAVLTKEEFEELVNSERGILKANTVLASFDDDNEKVNEYIVKFKLFNLFNIKNLRVNVVKNDEVLLGGDCIGLNLKSKGVVIVGSNYIITKQGNISPIEKSGLLNGDIITHLNETEISGLKDIENVLEECKGEEIKVSAKRKGEVFETKIKPELDVQTKKYKLGIWIRDDAMGVGTLTFINPDTLRFASLGHAIADVDTGENFEVGSGEVYKCNVVGVKMGKRGVPGEILGLFMQGKKIQGGVDKNCSYGVYGNLNENCELSLGKNKIKIGGRMTAKPGKAKILTCINGTDVEEFEIELIKTNYQTGGTNKSMVIKITDDDLINRTGGIVQGMSGSPIIQDGKIVGAVTHVFVNDPTKGFGLYLDWMVNE